MYDILKFWFKSICNLIQSKMKEKLKTVYSFFKILIIFNAGVKSKKKRSTMLKRRIKRLRYHLKENFNIILNYVKVVRLVLGDLLKFIKIFFFGFKVKMNLVRNVVINLVGNVEDTEKKNISRKETKSERRERIERWRQEVKLLNAISDMEATLFLKLLFTFFLLLFLNGLFCVLSIKFSMMFEFRSEAIETFWWPYFLTRMYIMYYTTQVVGWFLLIYPYSFFTRVFLAYLWYFVKDFYFVDYKKNRTNLTDKIPYRLTSTYNLINDGLSTLWVSVLIVTFVYVIFFGYCIIYGYQYYDMVDGCIAGVGMDPYRDNYSGFAQKFDNVFGFRNSFLEIARTNYSFEELRYIAEKIHRSYGADVTSSFLDEIANRLTSPRAIFNECREFYEKQAILNARGFFERCYYYWYPYYEYLASFFDK